LIYGEKVREHFLKPHNMGKMEHPDGVGKVGNIVCGDVMWLYIKVGKNSKGQRIISDIKWQTFGCAAAIATSSAVTDLAKGKTLEEALEISNKKVVDSLGGLPPVKIHCSVLAEDALGEAIYDYLKKNNLRIPKKLQERHEKIIADIKEIEERYKEFLQREETSGKKQSREPGF